MSVAKRLVEFHNQLKQQGYGGRNVFERAIGKKEGYLTTAAKKDTSIGSDVLEVLHRNFPSLNIDWLLTGEGSMYKDAYINIDPEREEKLVDVEEIKPMPTLTGRRGALVYDIDATCGVMSRPMDFAKERVIGIVDLPEIKESSPIIRANGDSMEPVIFDGDRIVVREVVNKNSLFYGQIYLIITEEYRMIKYIRKCIEDEDNYVILRSKNKEYDDIKLHRREIQKLFVVENILSVKVQL